MSKIPFHVNLIYTCGVSRPTTNTQYTLRCVIINKTSRKTNKYGELDQTFKTSKLLSSPYNYSQSVNVSKFETSKFHMLKYMFWHNQCFWFVCCDSCMDAAPEKPAHLPNCALCRKSLPMCLGRQQECLGRAGLATTRRRWAGDDNVPRVLNPWLQFELFDMIGA